VEVTHGRFTGRTGNVVESFTEHGDESVLVDLGSTGRHWLPGDWLKQA
jgi:hypothetical protein